MTSEPTDSAETHVKKAEISERQKELKVKREEVSQKINSGQDSEAAILIESFNSAISGELGRNSLSGSMRELSKTYSAARKSYQQINEAGEPDKLHQSLKGLYKIVGLDYDIQSLPENKRDLVMRMKVWQNERPITFPEQRRARGLITKALGNDITRSNVDASVSGEEVIASLKETFAKLEKATEGGKRELYEVRIDDVTKEKYTVKITKVGPDWIATELRDDGSVTKSEISANGDTELTIISKGKRFEESKANPDIKESNEYKGAAVVTFDLIANTFLHDKSEVAGRWAKDIVIPDRLKKDLDNFAGGEGKDYFLRGYVEKRAEADLSKAELKEEASKPDISRSAIRRKTYQVAKDELAFKSVEAELLEVTGQVDRLNEIKIIRSEKSEAVYQFPRSLDDEDTKVATDLLAQRKSSFIDELKQKGGKFAETFSSLDAGNQDVFITNVLNVERKMAVGRENLQISIAAGSPEGIFKQTAGIKHAEMDKAAVMAEIEVALAAKRREESLIVFKESYRNLIQKIAQGRPVQGLKDVTVAGLEVIRSVKYPFFSKSI